MQVELESEDSVTCQWDDCGVVFTHLPTLIEHIHNGEHEHSSRPLRPILILYQNTLVFINLIIHVNGLLALGEVYLKHPVSP